MFHFVCLSRSHSLSLSLSLPVSLIRRFFIDGGGVVVAVVVLFILCLVHSYERIYRLGEHNFILKTECYCIQRSTKHEEK